MSLNKLFDSQLGYDLNFELGCQNLLASEITVENANVLNLDASTIITSTLTVDGVPFSPHGNSNLQSVGMITKNVASTDIETDLFPSAHLGTADGNFPANSLNVGDVIVIDSFLQIQGAAGSILDLRLYNGTGSSLLATSLGMSTASFAALSDARLQISISIRDPLSCHLNGTFTAFNFADQSSKTWPFTAVAALFDTTTSNDLKLTTQWSAGHLGSTLSQQQLTYTRHSVDPIS